MSRNMGVVYINSTLQQKTPHPSGDELSPLHYWGYLPCPGDTFLRHRWNRYEIKLRYWLGGLDLLILLRVVFLLLAGRRRIYLVTQPDLIQAVPWLCRIFPSLKVVTWAWTAEEVRRWKPGLSCCRRVLCLSDAALAEMQKQGLGGLATIGIWGTDPEFYSGSMDDKPDDGVFFFGVANRDLATLQEAIRRAPFALNVTQRAAKSLPDLPREKLRIVGSTATARELAAMLWKMRVIVVPLHPGDLYPTGFTNVTEGSLCGCAVVLADCSAIPGEALRGPGIFLYRAGDAGSLLETLEKALRISREEGFRQRVRDWAKESLNGRKLEQDILKALEVAR